MSEEETVTATEEADVVPTDEETTETVDAEQAETEPTETSDAEGEDAGNEEKIDPRDRKLAELAYKEREARRRVAQMERLLEQRTSQPANEPKAPKIEDFDTIDDYVDAKLEYHDKLRQQGTEPAHAKTTESSFEDVDFRLNLDELYGNGVAKHTDFIDVVGAEHVPITQEMASTLFTLDDPDLQVDTAYFLGNNPKEAARIAQLPAVRQIAEVTRLADKILAKRAAPKTKPKSNAPKPPEPVKGGRTVTNELRDGMSYEDFLKVRNKQLGRG